MCGGKEGNPSRGNCGVDLSVEVVDNFMHGSGSLECHKFGRELDSGGEGHIERDKELKRKKG